MIIINVSMWDYLTEKGRNKLKLRKQGIVGGAIKRKTIRKKIKAELLISVVMGGINGP